METHALESALVGEGPPLLTGGIVVQRLAIPGADDTPVAVPAVPYLYGEVLLIFARFIQQRQHGRRQRDQPLT